MKETKTLLTDALSILANEGWGKNAYYNEATGCYCIMGALKAASGDLDVKDESPVLSGAVEYLHRALPESPPAVAPVNYIDDLISYNDHHATTGRDVFALFGRAIARAS